ncbi:hypothetical protein M9Y10_045686 [Tritrichomonas musculus]|uniref:Uncharacterized protein n=1 Tax=Tritrichomonas musculus TaxID=1915356 RepID=A0ABR2JX23_9EUKA
MNYITSKIFINSIWSDFWPVAKTVRVPLSIASKFSRASDVPFQVTFRHTDLYKHCFVTFCINNFQLPHFGDSTLFSLKGNSIRISLPFTQMYLSDFSIEQKLKTFFITFIFTAFLT